MNECCNQSHPPNLQALCFSVASSENDKKGKVNPFLSCHFPKYLVPIAKANPNHS